MPKFSIFTKIILIVFFALVLPLFFSNYFIISTYQNFINKYVSDIDSDKVLGVLTSLQKSAYFQNIVVFSIFLVIVFLVFVILSRVIVSPIRKLVEGTKKVADGNFETKVVLKTGDELEALAGSFNKMVERLKEAFFEAEEEKQKTMGIVSNFVDGVLFFNEKKDLKIINSQAEKFLMIDQSEKIVGKNINILRKNFYFPLISDLADQDEIKKVIKKIVSLKKDGEENSEVLFFETSVVPLSRGGKLFGYIIILHDITREKSLEKLKSEFISLAAHQLLTPTSVVKWTIDSVIKGEVGRVPKKIKESLGRAMQNNERVIAVVDDLLNVTRIEEGKFIGEFTEESLEKLIITVVESRHGRMEKNNIKIEINSSQKDCFVEVNKQSIILAIENLVDNAIEYSVSGGKVTIKISCDNIKTKVEFIDAGIGIPEEEQQKIFTKFFRGDNALKIKSSGTGLGLFIVKSIIEAHKGSIGFESQENKGSSFWFILPVINNK